MLRRLLALAVIVVALSGFRRTDPDRARWEARAARVTITRDEWGIPHVDGRTDADAVFGVVYAQAEDDFPRIETNYLVALGRLAEAEGPSAVYRDLRQRLFLNHDSLRAMYRRSPRPLRDLMTAWADGLNYYLHVHPEVQPRVLRRFEPWMALAFSEGSIGGDIEKADLAALEAFYGAAGPRTITQRDDRGMPAEPTGSNGIALAPSITASGRAMLLINPHTSFFFRAEAGMRSEEGLNAYGALTWGQFFIYQGFNDRVGWMHTTSGLDAVDEYAETVRQDARGMSYRYGMRERPLRAETIVIGVKDGPARTFTGWHSHHGPIVRQAGDGRWIAMRLMHRPIAALRQSWERTKARSWTEFRRTLALQANSSNNTIYADADGHIAYVHPTFLPKRDPRVDWSRPVDGSDPATEWQGLHAEGEVPTVIDPPDGWIQNTNNSPWTAAGAASPRAADFPDYVDRAGENPRGVHALRVLEGRRGFTLESLRAAAYDPALPAFDDLLPPLLQLADAADAAGLAAPLAALRHWDRRWDTASVATTVAVYWGEALWRRAAADPARRGAPIYDFMAAGVADSLRLAALREAVDTLTAHFGRWDTPWGAVNRFQRRTGDLVQPFADSAASVPVGFTSARWGSLASFGARTWPGTRRLYGTLGNSFVAVVEFGPRVQARAISAGGQSGDPRSPHFRDQAVRYATGDLRPVHFHPDEVAAHAQRRYRPGPPDGD